MTHDIGNYDQGAAAYTTDTVTGILAKATFGFEGGVFTGIKFA